LKLYLQFKKKEIIPVISAAFTPVFSVTCCFRNHLNILIWSSVMHFFSGFFYEFFKKSIYLK